MRTPTLLVGLALIAAACGGGTASTDTSTTTSTAPATTATDRAAVAASYTYAYTPDTTLTYQLTLDQQLSMVADGHESAFPDQELPVTVELDSDVDTTMDVSVYPGPEDGTYELEISASFGDMEVTGTVNGEPLDEAEGAFDESLAELDAIELTAVVDSQGNLLSITGPTGADALGGDLGALANLGNTQLGRPLGPAFPNRELAVGDTWTETTTEEGPSGPIAITSTHQVVAIEELDGEEVAVIDSTTEVDGYEIDLSPMLRGMFESFAGSGEDGDTESTLPPEVAEILDQIEFLISVAPSTSEATTWFDVDEGLVRRAIQDTVIDVATRFTGPDDTTGELVSFTFDMTIDQVAEFTLTGQG